MVVYVQVGLESVVNSVDLYGLILLLFEGVVIVMLLVCLYMDQNNIVQCGSNIFKVIDIIVNGLKVSFDLKVGGEFVEWFYVLYDYIV